MTTTLNKLTEIIKAYYNSQVEKGKAKNFQDCPYPCEPLANIAPYLKMMGIDWKGFGFEKLPELIQQLEGAKIYYRGVPFLYFCQEDSETSMANISNTPLNISPTSEEELSITQFRNPQPYEVRMAYRKFAKNKPSVWVPIKKLMTEVGWLGTPTQFTSKYKLQFNPMLNRVRVYNISKYEIVDDIYFDPQKNNYLSNLETLREMALDENWDDNGKRNKLLDNYLCYTYARIKDEGKIAISNDKLHACWNTGLVDYRYRPIYCYMVRKDTANRWIFRAFCVDGEDIGKLMAANISVMPERARYFEENNLLYDPDKSKLSRDNDHIIREHPSRLPLEWLKEVLKDSSNWLENETSDDYDKRIGDMLPKESKQNIYLQTLLEQTIDESVKRCQWNYKTAIPYYDPTSKEIGWFLPLCRRDDKEKMRLVPFAALVVTKEKSGRFQGQTIYRLSWAYRCARLVCRPDSDWLTPLFTNNAKLDAEE